MNNEDVEQQEEDKEVEQIIRKGKKETKRRLATGILILFYVRQVEQCTVKHMCNIIVFNMNRCQTCRTVKYLLF